MRLLVVAALLAPTTVLAQLPTEPWLQYGCPGLVVLGLLTGWIITAPAHKSTVERAERAEAALNAREEEITRLRDRYEAKVEQFAPLLHRAATAVERHLEQRRERGGSIDMEGEV